MAISGLLFCLIGSYLIWQTVHARARQIAGLNNGRPTATVVDDARPLPAFSLQQLNGTVTDATLRGRWTLLLFGYTHCPVVCPTELALLKRVKAQLKQSSSITPQVIFVSVDSRRDSIALLDRFVREFDPEFIGATAADDSIVPLAGHLGAYFQRNDRSGEANYTVDHSTSIYLIDRGGQLKAVFDPPQHASDMVRRLVAISNE